MIAHIGKTSKRKEKEGACRARPHLQTHFSKEKDCLFFANLFPKVDKLESQMRLNDYALHAIGINLQNATTSDKVEMMEETLKVVSSYFIRKTRHLEKIQAKNADLRESVTQQRKEDKARSSKINRLQGLLT